MSRRDITEITKELERQGFEVKMGGSGHWKIYDDERLIATLPATPGDHRSLRNCLAILRRAGFAWPPQ